MEREAKRCNEKAASNEDQDQVDDEEIGTLCGSSDEEEEATPQVKPIDDFKRIDRRGGQTSVGGKSRRRLGNDSSNIGHRRLRLGVHTRGRQGVPTARNAQL